jgi:uncharacterized protein
MPNSAVRVAFLATAVIALTYAEGVFAGEPAAALPRPKARVAVPLQAEPFSLDAVRLLDGPFKRSQDAAAKYLLSLEADRLLARFRVEAGLTPKAKNYPGWEDVELPGVGAGFYLSGCARMHAVTGDRRFLDRVRYMLDELEACQKANGNGYLLATKNGQRIFAEIERGTVRIQGWKMNGECEPYYAMEKLFSGLRDAWRVCGERKALDIEARLADWLEQHMSHLSDEQMQNIMKCEWGGVNWVLADLYADTGNPRYLALSRRWHQTSIFDPLARGIDILPNKHANTQFPKICGLASRYAYSGDTADRITAEFFWDRVVGHHSYVTGGNSFVEHFGPPDKLNNRLGTTTTELCNSYNMLRLTMLLYSIAPQARHADFLERTLLNHVLPAQHPGDGRICYYTPLQSGYAKPYETLYETFACCTCSSMDGYAKHGEYIYAHDAGGLWVNLFIASEVQWRDKGVTLRQETAFPEESRMRLAVTCAEPVRFNLRVRYPVWATQGMSIRINGEKQPAPAVPGSYVALDRTWKTGDRVELDIPQPLRIESMPDNPRRIAIFAGPVLLAGDLGPAGGEAGPGSQDDVPVLLTGDRPLSDWVKPAGAPLGFKLTGVGRPRDLDLAPFYRLHDHRYVVYWDAVTPPEWEKRRSELAAEEARRAELEAATVDKVDIGVPASETAHALQGDKTETGRGVTKGMHMNARWRRAESGGYFRYEMKVMPDQEMSVQCTYWTKEAGRRGFDILVDDQKIDEETRINAKLETLYVKVYPLPKNLTQGKNKIAVKFRPHADCTTGGVFGVRVTRTQQQP